MSGCKLGTYLVKITQQELTSGQNKEVSKLLHTISDFERISDHAVNISQAAAELFNEKLRFSDCAVVKCFSGQNFTMQTI